MGARVVAAGRSFPSTALASPGLRVTGDLLDPVFRHRLERVLRQKKVEAIFHLAAESESAVTASRAQTMMEGNIGLTRHVLEMARRVRVRYFLFTSTVKVYGASHPRALRETDLPHPETLYASTKLAAESLVQGYARTFGFSYDIARLSNVYGPHSSPVTVVGRVLRLLQRKEPLRLGNLAAVRDFIFVDDVVAALLALWNRAPRRDGRVLHVSTGKPTTIRDMATIARKVFGAVRSPLFGARHSGDVLVLSQRRMRSMTGWRPHWSLARGLTQCRGAK